MQRRDFIIGTAAAAAAGLSACLGPAQQATDAATGGGDSGRTVTVTGSAEMQAAPDRAVIEASVEATGDSAAAVRDELSTRSDSLRQALRNAGLDDDQLTTGRFAIRPQYNRREPGAEPEQTGYEGTHTTTIEVDDVDATGDVIDTAIDGGADSIGRIEYTLRRRPANPCGRMPSKRLSIPPVTRRMSSPPASTHRSCRYSGSTPPVAGSRRPTNVTTSLKRLLWARRSSSLMMSLSVHPLRQPTESGDRRPLKIRR